MTLEEATIDDIFDEILNRCNFAVLALAEDHMHDNNIERTRYLYGGGTTSCYGLAQSLSDRLCGIILENEEDA